MAKTDLKNMLQEWTDPDIAEYYLACCLGILILDDNFESFRESKHIFWTGNRTSSLLNRLLFSMVEAGLLDFDEEENMFRWNNSYVVGGLPPK